MDFLSNLPILIGTIAATLFSLFVLKTITRKSSPRKYHPIAGTIFNQLLNFSRLHDYMTDLARKYRTYRLLAPFNSEIYTSDPANIEHILKTNFSNYAKGSYNYSKLSDLMGDGIFTVDGDKWRHQRKISSYEFSAKVLRDFGSVVFRKNAVKLSNIVSEAATSKKSMDIQDLFMRSTLDSIFEVACGIDLDSICGSSEEGANFAYAFDESSELTLWRYVDIFWKIKRFLRVGTEATLKKNIEVIDGFVYKLIDSKKKNLSSVPDNSSMKKGDILSRFLDLNGTDPKYLRDIILSIIIAGKDTTAATLSWFLYMLCKHPQVQEKVAQEVRETTESKEDASFSEFAEGITEEALEKMHYLHAALTETLRLYPALPVDVKVCLSDDIWPDGFQVRKGDMVAYQPYAMGRLPFIWGDDAEDFRPERWLDKDGGFHSESPFKFTAFQVRSEKMISNSF